MFRCLDVWMLSRLLLLVAFLFPVPCFLFPVPANAETSEIMVNLKLDCSDFVSGERIRGVVDIANPSPEKISVGYSNSQDAFFIEVFRASTMGQLTKVSKHAFVSAFRIDSGEGQKLETFLGDHYGLREPSRYLAKPVLVHNGVRYEGTMRAFDVVDGIRLSGAMQMFATRNGLREVTARLPQPVVVAKEYLKLLPLPGVDPETRHKRMLRDLRQLLHGARAEDLDEKAVLRIRVADTDLLGRGIRDVHHAADALAGHEVGGVQLQIDHDLGGLRVRGDREQGTGNREQNPHRQKDRGKRPRHALFPFPFSQFPHISISNPS